MWLPRGASLALLYHRFSIGKGMFGLYLTIELPEARGSNVLGLGITAASRYIIHVAQIYKNQAFS